MNPQVTATTDNRAFRTSFSNPNPTARAKGTTTADWCNHCKRAGHKADGCWILHPHLRPSSTKAERGARKGGGEPRFFGGVSQQTGTGLLNQNQRIDTSKPAAFNTEGGECVAGSSVASTTQLNQLLTQLNSLLQQQTTDFVQFNPISSSFNSNASSLNPTDLGHGTTNWVIDSGATDHMTWDQNKL
jgi:hypothetical protein